MNSKQKTTLVLYVVLFLFVWFLESSFGEMEIQKAILLFIPFGMFWLIFKD